MRGQRKPKDPTPDEAEIDDPQSAIRNPQSAIPNNYTVLARRYRPQQFADLVGQEAAAQALVNALKSGRVAHAYLFTGARGVGKTSTARILAKALNCVNGPTPTPCGQCENCRAIAEGQDIDVIEIDAASNNGIDDIRELRVNAQYRPSRSRFKIYIIDEVHMLGGTTKGAFGALLKTLEEPPPHVKFIFATTDIHKIPITILSRCQRFDFGGIGAGKIVKKLREVVQAEGLKADDDALEMVARRAGGSMRDAQSLLDQLLAFGGERLTGEQVHQLLGTAGDDRVAELASAIIGHEAAKALEFLARTAEEGLQIGELVDQLIEYWRDLMVLKCAGTDAKDLNVSARSRETVVRQADGLSLDTILAGLDILAATKARLRGSNHARTLVEMALVRLGRLDDLISLAQLADWMKGGAAPPAASSPALAKPPAAAPGKPPPPPPAKPQAANLTAESLQRIWAEVLAQLPPMLRGDLEKAGLPAIFAPNTLVLRFGPDYNAQGKDCQEPRRVEKVEALLRSLTGQAWNLRVESVAGEKASRQAPASEEPDATQSRSRRQRDEALREPLVKRAIEVLGASIVRVDDGFGTAPAASGERAEDTEEG